MVCLRLKAVNVRSTRGNQWEAAICNSAVQQLSAKNNNYLFRQTSTTPKLNKSLVDLSFIPFARSPLERLGKPNVWAKPYLLR